MPPKVEKEVWNVDHTREVLREIIHIVLSNRPSVYSLPSLQGVADNRGDRINKKIQQILKKVCELYPGSQGLVEEEIKNLVKERSNGTGTPSPKKKNGGNGGTPKKRKVKDDEDE